MQPNIYDKICFPCSCVLLMIILWLIQWLLKMKKNRIVRFIIDTISVIIFVDIQQIVQFQHVLCAVQWIYMVCVKKFTCTATKPGDGGVLMQRIGHEKYMYIKLYSLKAHNL